LVFSTPSALYYTFKGIAKYPPRCSTCLKVKKYKNNIKITYFLLLQNYLNYCCALIFLKESTFKITPNFMQFLAFCKGIALKNHV
jgi:hypothetical protein